MDKYYLIKTYGCQMNIHESEKLAGMLQSLGYIETEEENKADVVVFNTCCIRDGAEQKIYAHIGALKGLKKQKPNLVVAICGCMTQIKSRPETIKKKFPFVNIIFGTHNLNEFKTYLENYNANKKYICDIWDEAKYINEDVETYRTSNNNAWVNISYGCNNFCTYCIVPYVRGRERSRSFDDIIKECKQAIKDGYQYITLLGQNVNSYGNDIDDSKVTFANLLRAVADLDGDFRLKFMTNHPKDLSEEVIDVIATHPKIAKVIHLPLQSGSNKILKAMNRKYTTEDYMHLIDMIRAKIPNCYISTDIIVGFPGETEEDFLDTYNLLDKIKYDGVFAFMYSKRDGTVAASMDNQVDQKVKNERVNKLLTLTKQITKDKNKESIGQEYNVYIEQYDGQNNAYITKTDSGKTIIVEHADNLDKKKFYIVKVVKFCKNKLYGEII